MDLVQDRKSLIIIKLQWRIYPAKERLLINNAINLKMQAIQIERFQIFGQILKKNKFIYEGAIF